MVNKPESSEPRREIVSERFLDADSSRFEERLTFAPGRFVVVDDDDESSRCDLERLAERCLGE